MSGGQGRLKPSPGSFLVASMPSLLPIAISLVAWSSTSAGPLVKMLSRCGPVLAQRRKRTSLVVMHVHVVHEIFGEHHLPNSPEAVHDFVGLHRVGLAAAHEH